MTIIDHKKIPKEVQETAQYLEDAGFEAYLVGGCTRDLLLNKKPKDWDLTTNAKPEEIISLFPQDRTFCNNDFGTVGIKNENSNEKTVKIIEVTPYRTEGTYSDLRRPDTVTFGVSLHEDLKRRDFTINALAYRIKTKELVDEFDGKNDLIAKRIKAVGNPDKRFEEDALRMMRAVRLATELEFMIDAKTTNAIVKNNEKLSMIAIERVSEEFLRIINSKTPMQGVILLEKLGLIKHFIPELLLGIGCKQGGAHAFDVYEHLLRTLQATADKNYSLTMRLAALFHDIAKPHTRKTGGKNKFYTFFGHEIVGAKLTNKIMKRLKLPNELTQKVVNLIRWHMFFADPDKITLSAVRRTITKVGKENINDLLNLRVCDRIGTGRPKEQPFRFRKYKALVDQALRDPISVKMLKINGNQIMEIAKEKPGKRLGLVLHALLEEVLDDAGKNNSEYLKKRSLELLSIDDHKLESLAKKGKEKITIKETEEINQILKRHSVF